MLEWTFAPNANGEERGYHDAGVETFKGNLERYLARELIQNSIDAQSDSSRPVEVTFELKSLARDDVPGIADLASTFKSCATYWEKDKKAKDFFVRARQIARHSEIPCLKVSDSNTTGVPGTDTQRDQGWYNLVRCSGSSAKGGGEGGSFGLGKNAPFAASRLRTVLYSTQTDEGSVAFQGVARLVTHDADSERKQPTGYLGGPNGKSIRVRNSIPKVFRRTDPGTTVFALGYHAFPEWREEFIYSVLEYFWPAIHRNKLIVHIEDHTVSKNNLAAILEEYGRNYQGFDAHLYYKAYTDSSALEITSELSTLGKTTVRLIVGDSSYPNHVAMVRKTGMVIYHRRTRSRASYCGVFECLNKTGNSKLRDMEPPRHDDWDGDLPEKGDNRATKKELDNHVIECVRALTPASTETTITIPDLNQYLPDDGESPEDAFDGPPADGAGRHESFERTPETQSIRGRHMGRNLATRQGGESTGDGEGTLGGDDAGNQGGEPNDGGGGDRGSSGGGGESGVTGGEEGRVPIDVRSRAFLADSDQGLYRVTIHPPNPRPSGEVFLSLSAVGDDAASTPMRIQEARVSNRRVGVSQQPSRVGPVVFPRSGPLRVEIILAERRRLALEVTAYEATDDEIE